MSLPSEEYWKQFRKTWVLAFPIIMGQLGQMLMGWVDNIMVGRVGVVPLAACAFGNIVLQVPFLFGVGVLTAVSVQTSHHFGAKNFVLAGKILRAGLLIALVLGISVFALFSGLSPFLSILGQNAEVTAEARPFIIIVGASLIPVYLTLTAKSFCEACSRPWLPFWITLIGVGVNVFINWLLIYGNWGFPAMGLTGAAWGTFIGRVLIVLILFTMIWHTAGFRTWLPKTFFRGITWVEIRSLLHLGLPAGLHLISEVGIFAACATICGWISVEALAAHQIVLTCAATAFMFPLGLAMALTIRVGQVMGAGQNHLVRPICAQALSGTTVMMLCFAVLFLLLRKVIGLAFVDDQAVIALTAQLFFAVAAFQIFDGWQVVCVGALRGLADVRIPFVFTLIAYWLIALPLAYFLGYKLWGAIGVWTALLIGLAVVSLPLIIRLWWKTKTQNLPVLTTKPYPLPEGELM